MGEGPNRFDFVGALYKEEKWFVALCLDVDVASQGRTAREARRMLAEAVALYLEGCFESNIPYLRPVPRDQDPRFNQPEDYIGLFPVKVAFKVRAVA
jgi:predicted RNase H-like HicB family nuclease